MDNISQRFSAVHSEIQHINDKFTELSNKIAHVKSISDILRALQDDKVQYEFNLTWKTLVQNEATITLEKSDIEWREIRQYLIKYLSNKKTRLEESIRCSLDVLEQRTKF